MSAACPICCEVFRASDDINGTICGHVFHSLCLRNWELQSPTCPKCRREHYSKFKVYFSFEDDFGQDKKILELKANFDKNIINLSKLQAELEKNNELLTTMQEKNSKEMDDMSQKYAYVSIQNDEREKMLIIKDNVICTLKEAYKTSNKADALYVFNARVVSLESQVKTIMSKLSAEEDKCRKLSLENERLKMEEKDRIAKKTAEQQIKQTAETSTSSVAGAASLAVLQDASEHKIDYKNAKARIVIQGLQTNEKAMPIPKFILSLACIMGVELKEADIYGAHFLDTPDELETCSVTIAFRDIPLKYQFLNSFPALERLGYEHLSAGHFNFSLYLLKYARNVLKPCGYAHIFKTRTSVFAQKTRLSEKIRIFSIKQVDDLKTQHLLAESSDSDDEEEEDNFIGFLDMDSIFRRIVLQD